MSHNKLALKNAMVLNKLLPYLTTSSSKSLNYFYTDFVFDLYQHLYVNLAVFAALKYPFNSYLCSNVFGSFVLIVNFCPDPDV